MGKRQQPPDTWAWLCRWAEQHDVPLRELTFAEAADRLLAILERQQGAGFPLDFRAVELASALVRLEAESAISGASDCKRVRDQMFYRKVADALFTRACEVAAWRRRAGLVNEPVEETAPEGEFMTLNDLLRQCNELLRLVRQDKARLKAQPGHA